MIVSAFQTVDPRRRTHDISTTAGGGNAAVTTTTTYPQPRDLLDVARRRASLYSHSQAGPDAEGDTEVWVAEKSRGTMPGTAREWEIVGVAMWKVPVRVSAHTNQS